jgi:hypothetical protein
MRALVHGMEDPMVISKRRPGLSLLALLLFAGLFQGAVGVSAQETTTITIHVRFCPENVTVTDYFAQCHGNTFVHGHYFYLLDDDNRYQNKLLDPETGNVTFETVRGTVRLYGGLPDEFVETFVYCSQNGEMLLESSAADVTFDVGTGDVVCDWYQTPKIYRTLATPLAPGETTTITIHYRACPDNARVTDYFSQCHDMIPTKHFLFSIESATEHFTVRADAETGNATFETSRDIVQIFNGASVEWMDTYIYCSQNGERLMMIGFSSIILEPGAGEVVCDFYQKASSFAV